MGLSSRITLGLLGVGIATAITSLAQPAAAYGIKHTRSGDRVHWEPTAVSFEVDPSVADVVPGADEAVKTAMGSWSGVAGAPRVQDVATSAPDVPSYDKRNTIVYKPQGYAPAGRALAITVLTYDDATGRILDADIIVNGAYTFALPDAHQDPALHPSNVDTESTGAPDDPEASVHRTFDFQHVLAHELGHSLGLSDEVTLSDALMYRYSAPDVQLRRAPHADDIAGLEQLYGEAPTSMSASGAGCGGATVSPKRPDAQTSTLAFAFTLGLIAFLALRARKQGAAARVALLVSASAFVAASLPAVSKSARGDDLHGAAADSTAGHATARVTKTQTSISQGLLRTHVTLDVTACRVASCPTSGEADTWGGRAGNIVQIVGNHPLPASGDLVEIEIPHARAGVPALQVIPSRIASGALRIVSVR